MKNNKYIILLLAILTLLTGCSTFDSNIISQTSRPNLLKSPIEGRWVVTDIVESKSRFTFKEGDEFIFDIDLFATPREVFLDPEYEVQYITDKQVGIIDDKYGDINIEHESAHVIRLLRRGRSTINIIKESEDTALLIVSDQIVRLKQVEDVLTANEKTEIIENYSLRRQAGVGMPWAIAIGVRDYVPDPMAYRSKGVYTSYILSYDGKEYTVNTKDGLLISEGSNLDHYEIIREKTDDGNYMDNIYLNGNLREVIDATEERQSPYLGISYLSENYMALDYLKPAGVADTISVYSTRNIEGLIQLKSDDIIRFSSDQIYDRAINSQTDMRLSNLVYNIGIYRENGIIILKGRIPVSLDKEILNRDFAISGDFDIYQDRDAKYKMSRRLRDRFPEMVDFYMTGDENKVAIVTEDSIKIYDISADSLIELGVDLDETSKIVSGSVFQGESLEELYEFVNQN